ncbi:MAG TPA: carbohydrate binding domain-containing protein [Candidatus Acidoferrum sp.]|nr:carbohydrate binding domain-containing protein [Candidatus Acidoferrum sp.]
MFDSKIASSNRLWPALALLLLCLALPAAAAGRYADRFVWVFGWNLGNDSDVAQITRVLESAGAHGCNGAVLSAGLDSLSKQSPAYFRRLDQIQQACRQNHLELIPSVFSIGYGGGALAHDPNLAEGVPVVDAPLVVHNGAARLAPAAAPALANGGFEDFTGNRLKNFNFHDQPGEVSFVDTTIKHSGRASLRLENFTANPYGHGRVMQEIAVPPHRCYRVSLWVKTENLQPADAFHLMALAGKDQEIAPRNFNVPSTTDWRKISMLFNSLSFDKIRLYAGLWGGKSGKVWLDDWSIEETGPVNVLHRPGTPVAIRSDDGSVTYSEGRDYAALLDPALHPWNDTGEAVPLQILPGGRIQEGQTVRASWYHSMIIYDSQVTVCMAEPALYQFFDQEAALLASHLHPRRVLLNMDEVRMGGTCRACQGKNMGELIGQCVAQQAQIIRRHAPGAGILLWADMFDPFHNAHGHYYLVDGDFTGSWEHVPKDVTMVVWGGEPRPKDLHFFADHGFHTLAACYYDAEDLNGVKAWLQAAGGVPLMDGFIYTPWQKKYSLLPAFGDLLQ